MCESSLYVPNRLAKDRERLVLKQVLSPSGRFTGHMGFYPRVARSDHPKLVCMRRMTDATVSGIKLDTRQENTVGAYPAMAKAIKSMTGKTVKVKFVPAGQFPANIKYGDTFCYHDSLIINDVRIPLFMLEAGLHLDIGEAPVRIRRPRGMRTIEAAVKEAMALPPDPKPDNGDEGPAPAEEPEEHRERQPEAPTTAQ